MVKLATRNVLSVLWQIFTCDLLIRNPNPLRLRPPHLAIVCYFEKARTTGRHRLENSSNNSGHWVTGVCCTSGSPGRREGAGPGIGSSFSCCSSILQCIASHRIKNRSDRLTLLFNVTNLQMWPAQARHVTLEHLWCKAGPRLARLWNRSLFIDRWSCLMIEYIVSSVEK